MPLTAEEVKALLALPPKTRGGRKSKNGIDTSERTVMVWFKLAHKMFDEETGELAHCQNENCQDTREHHLVVSVNGFLMCRRCFLDGWKLEVEGQQVLNGDGE